MAKGKSEGSETAGGDGSGLERLKDELAGLAGRLDRRFEETGRLAHTSGDVSGSSVYVDVLDSLRRSFETVIPFDRLGFSLLEEDSVLGAERWISADGGEPEIDEGEVPLDDSGLAGSLQARQPLIVKDLAAFSRHHRWHTDSESTARAGMRSALACPLVTLSKWVGFLFFYSGRKEAYAEAHQAALRSIAEPLAMLIEKSRLYEELIELNRDLAVVRQALDYQSTHDPMTRVWSRPAIMGIVANDLARSRRDKRPITAVIADIDDLKRINNEHGYVVGDAVVRAVAQRLAGSLRSYESIGRYGGEEFLIALYACDERGAVKVTSRLAALVSAAPVEIPDGEVAVTVSLGAAVSPHSEEADAERLVRTAEEALERAKSHGAGSAEITTVRPEEDEDESD